MKSASLSSIDGSMGKLRSRLEQWRSAHPGRSFLPEQLREAVVELARVQGGGPTARGLKLPSSTVYRWLREHGPQALPSPEKLPTFVELVPQPCLSEAPSPPPVPAAATLELRTPDGASLHLQLSTGTGLDVPALVEAFLRSRPCSR